MKSITKSVKKPSGVVIVDVFAFLDWLDRYTVKVIKVCGVDAVFCSDTQNDRIILTFREVEKGPCQLCTENKELALSRPRKQSLTLEEVEKAQAQVLSCLPPFM